jgi:hypothetical protein
MLALVLMHFHSDAHAVDLPDLTVTLVSAPANAGAGTAITVSDTVTASVGSVGQFMVSFYLSTDDVITTSDTYLGSRSVSSLAAGASNSGNMSVTLPQNISGSYFIGAIVDTHPATGYNNRILESDEAHNALAGNQIYIGTDTTPPVGSIIINGGAAATNTVAVTLTTSATDTQSGVSQMQFSNDNATWSTAEPYATTKNWTLIAGDGPNKVYAKFKNGMGLWSDAADSTSTINLDTMPPALTLSTLPDGSYTNNATLNIAGTATDNTGIQSITTLNGAVVIVNADGTFSQVVTLATGTNTITTVVTDLAGNTTTDTRTIILDQTLPTLTVTNPADNSVVSSPTVTVDGTTDKISTVLISVNSGPTVTAAVNATSFSLPVTLATNTGNTILVHATDLAGNPVTAKRTVTHDDANPALAITAPNQDMGTTRTSITVSGTVSDLSAVQLLVSCPTASVGVVNTPTATTWSVDITNLQQGTNTVTVTATDQAGNSTTVVRNIIYTQTPVTIDPVNTPTNISQQTMTGTRELNSTVMVSCPTATVGTIDYPTPTTWQVIIADMAEGDNFISATATDLEGHGSDPVTAKITLDTISPIVTISSPASGLMNTNTPLLAYTTADAGTISSVLVKVDGNAVSKVSGDHLDALASGPTHTVRVEATDAAGNTGYAQVVFAVDATPPNFSINPLSSPVSYNTATISGTMDIGTTITATVNTTASVGPVSYPTSTTWRCTISGIVSGANIVTVKAADSAGNTASAVITLDTSLVGLWHMDGAWTDASGNGNNGTPYSGATFTTTAMIGSQAGSFDGVNDYVIVKSSPLISSVRLLRK